MVNGNCCGVRGKWSGYNSSQSSCCKNIVYRYLNATVCKDICFDPVKSLCCLGVLWNQQNQPNVFCCGANIYNAQRSYCCNNTYIVYSNGPYPTMCGNNCYNPSFQSCCSIAGKSMILNGTCPLN